jgi:hypothetical protein
VGQHGPSGRTGADPLGLGGDPPQHRRDQLRHRKLHRAQQHSRLVDTPLRVGLEPRRIKPRAALGVPPGQQPAGVRRVHPGAQQRSGVEQQRADLPGRQPQRRHGVRGAKVDRQREPAATRTVPSAIQHPGIMHRPRVIE